MNNGYAYLNSHDTGVAIINVITSEMHNTYGSTFLFLFIVINNPINTAYKLAAGLQVL